MNFLRRFIDGGTSEAPAEGGQRRYGPLPPDAEVQAQLLDIVLHRWDDLGARSQALSLDPRAAEIHDLLTAIRERVSLIPTAAELLADEERAEAARREYEQREAAAREAVRQAAAAKAAHDAADGAVMRGRRNRRECPGLGVRLSNLASIVGDAGPWCDALLAPKGLRIERGSSIVSR